MMLIKRIWPFFVALALLTAVLLTGCGTESGTETDTQTETNAATTAPTTETTPPTDTATETGSKIETAPAPETETDTESATASETETEPETETKVEPRLDIRVPTYEDIGLTAYLVGTDGQAYAVADTCTELREYAYLLCDKVQYTCRTPIILQDGVALMDAQTVAELFGFLYAETDSTATLTRDDATLVFVVGEDAVTLNGHSFDFPTVVKPHGTILLAADYFARWMGYTVTMADRSVYFTATADQLTEERKQDMDDRYELYQNVVYNYADVEADQTGVGRYEQTPYEDRLVGIAYTTWHSLTLTNWGESTWDVPLYGGYASDDPEVLYRHAIQLRDAGVDFVFVDWSNNTGYDPLTMRDQLADFRMIEEATDALFAVWSTVEGAPKICIMTGPGHNGIGDVKNGKHQKKADQIYRDYVEKYPDLYFCYEGKPLLMCYGATPNQYGTNPSSDVWNDDRYTVRWITGYVGQQSSLFTSRKMRSYGFWSWEERGAQTYTVIDGRVECITVTAASRSQGSEGDDNYIPAYGRENGATLKRQFQRANDLGAGIVLLVSWNEWTDGEQPSVEISKDLEPSQIHGTFYYDLLCEQIKKYKGLLDHTTE